MKLHPAIKTAKSIMKKHGFDCLYVGTLSMHVICREYNERPLIIDLILSRNDEKAKIDVCWLSSDHSMYKQVMALNGLEFTY